MCGAQSNPNTPVNRGPPQNLQPERQEIRRTLQVSRRLPFGDKMTNSNSQRVKYQTSAINELDLSGLSIALVRAIQEGWKIAPVAAHSRHASLKSSCLADPTSDPEEIAHWVKLLPDVNWCVETGRRSGLLVLEVVHENGQDLLSELCQDGWDFWFDTLKFQDQQATYFLFRYAGERVRFFPSRMNGIKIHAGNLLLLPPCWFVTGSPLVYSEPSAKLVGSPAFLLGARECEGKSAKVIPFPLKPQQ